MSEVGVTQAEPAASSPSKCGSFIACCTARLKILSVCCDTTFIFLEYDIVAMGRRSMNVDGAVMR
jgi:hypothetical protein